MSTQFEPSPTDCRKVPPRPLPLQMTRRGTFFMLAGLAAVPAASAADADLLRLFAQWRANDSEYERLSALADVSETDAEELRFGELADCFGRANGPLETSIASLPARTMAGLQAKARVAHRYSDATLGDVERSLLADILRGISA